MARMLQLRGLVSPGGDGLRVPRRGEARAPAAVEIRAWTPVRLALRELPRMECSALTGGGAQYAGRAFLGRRPLPPTAVRRSPALGALPHRLRSLARIQHARVYAAGHDAHRAGGRIDA